MLFFYLLIVVQIVVESLPVSSSGHVALLKHLFVLGAHENPLGHCLSLLSLCEGDDLLHFLHGPTILIVTLFFTDRWLLLLCSISRCWRIVCKIVVLTAVADVCTVLFFLLFKIIGVGWWPLYGGFMITACALYSLRWHRDTRVESWNMHKAILLGVVQGMALLPGVSRFALTYVTGRWLRLPARKAFEISLLIQWPLLVAAFVKSLYSLCTHALLDQLLNLRVVFTMLVASGVAFVLLHVVAYMALRRKWWLFSFYIVAMLLIMSVIE